MALELWRHKTLWPPSNSWDRLDKGKLGVFGIYFFRAHKKQEWEFGGVTA